MQMKCLAERWSIEWVERMIANLKLKYCKRFTLKYWLSYALRICCVVLWYLFCGGSRCRETSLSITTTSSCTASTPFSKVRPCMHDRMYSKYYINAPSTECNMTFLCSSTAILRSIGTREVSPSCGGARNVFSKRYELVDIISFGMWMTEYLLVFF